MAKFQHGSLIFNKNIETLNTDKTLYFNSEQLQFLNPTSENINIYLPDESQCTGLGFWIINTSNAYKLNIYDDSSSFICNINPNDVSVALCNGTVWKLDVEYHRTSVISKSEDYALSIFDDVVLVNCTSDIDITLPEPSLSYKPVVIKRIDDTTSYNLTILPNSTEMIDGQNSKIITSQYEYISLISDNYNWFVIG